MALEKGALRLVLTKKFVRKGKRGADKKERGNYPTCEEEGRKRQDSPDELVSQGVRKCPNRGA